MLAGIDPKYAIAGAFGLAFVGLVVVNVTVGLCAFAFVSFLEVLVSVGGSFSFPKVVGLPARGLLARGHLDPRTTRARASSPRIPRSRYRARDLRGLGGAQLVWAESAPAAFDASFRYLQNMILFLIVYTAIRKREHAVWMSAAFVTGATIAAVSAIIYRPDPGQYDVARAAGTVGDPNELASLLVAGVILAGVLIVLLKRSPALRLAAASARRALRPRALLHVLARWTGRAGRAPPSRPSSSRAAGGHRSSRLMAVVALIGVELLRVRGAPGIA